MKKEYSPTNSPIKLYASQDLKDRDKEYIY